MGSSGISLILLGVIGVFGVIFYFINKRNTVSESKTKSNNSDEQKVKNEKKSEIKKEDVFNFMEFDKIQDDMIVQNKGQKFTMAIKCKGINYDLMSDVEQMAVEEGFITFLNTLKYPIQLYVQAQNIDLKGAINIYKENISSIKNEFEEKDLEYTKVNEAFESTQEEIDEAARKRDEVLNVYEYANDIISYVERMSMNKSLLQRSFYVLISYYTSEINATEKFSKEEIDNICYTELYTRAQATISALAACSVEGKILNSNELADLLYTAYNRDDKGLMNVKEAIESGFYRLYSTSKDAFAKREEMVNEEIEKNAKIKAYQAILDTINDGSYVSPKSDALKIEEDTSRLANEYIRRENIPSELKEAAQKKVVDEYRETKKQVLKDISVEKEQLVNEANKVLGIQQDRPANLNATVENNGNKINNNIQDNKVENVIENEIKNNVRNEIITDSNKVDVHSSENDSIV